MRQEFGKNLPKNVFFIEPEMKIKPYDLFPIIDLGIIFSGTLGLEMMLNGKPVVTTGITPHFGLEFANEPNNEKDYELILKGKKFIKYPSIKEVRKFAYFYFIKSCIPWDLQNNAYGGYFTGFNFNSINDLNPGKNKYLDHVCNCLINRDKNVIENW